MTTDTLESDETPEARVGALGEDEVREALVCLVASILAGRDTRDVPAILNGRGLLSRFEMHDADHAWTEAEDRAVAEYREATDG